MTTRSSSASTSRGPAELAKKLLLALASVAVFLSIGEGLARLLDPEPAPGIHREHQLLIKLLGLPALNEVLLPDPVLFWRLKAGLSRVPVEGVIRHARDYPVRFTLSTNRAGLRGQEIQRGDGTLRVLALGDSTTFGLGVDDGATWPAALERILLAGAGRPVQVINAGVPGYTAYQGLRYLEEEGLALKPDLVLATFGFNDVESWSSRSDYQTARILAVQAWERPFLRSRFYTALKWLGGRGETERFSLDNAPRLSPAEYTATLERMRAACAARGIPIAVVIWPLRWQQDNRESALVGYQPLTASFAEEAGVRTVNLVDVALREQESLFLDHVHANARGQRLFAEAVAAVSAEALRATRPP